MLAEGKITVDEAERLINAILGSDKSAESRQPGDAPSKGKPKFLRVEVDKKDEERVNIRVPLALLSSGIKLAKFIPGNARKQVDDALKDKGVDFDLNSLLKSGNFNELVSALADLEINVDNDGDRVRIHCE